MPLFTRKRILALEQEPSEGQAPSTLLSAPGTRVLRTVESPTTSHDRELQENTEGRTTLTPGAATPGPGSVTATVITELQSSNNPLALPRWARALLACGFRRETANRVQRVICPTLATGVLPSLGEQIDATAGSGARGVLVGYVRAKFDAFGAAGATHDALYIWPDTGDEFAVADQPKGATSGVQWAAAVLVGRYGTLLRPDSENWVSLELDDNLAAAYGAVSNFVGKTLVLTSAAQVDNRGAGFVVAYNPSVTVESASTDIEMVQNGDGTATLILGSGSWTNTPTIGARIEVSGYTPAANNRAWEVLDADDDSIVVDDPDGVAVSIAASDSVTITVKASLVMALQYGTPPVGGQLYDAAGTAGAAAKVKNSGGSLNVNIDAVRQVRGYSLHGLDNLDRRTRQIAGLRGNASFEAAAGRAVRLTMEFQGQFVDAYDANPPATIGFGQLRTAERMRDGSIWLNGAPFRIRSANLAMGATIANPDDANSTDGRAATLITGRQPEYTLEMDTPGEGAGQLDAALRDGVDKDRNLALQVGTSEGRVISVVSHMVQVTANGDGDADGVATTSLTVRALDFNADGAGGWDVDGDNEVLVFLG